MDNGRRESKQEMQVQHGTQPSQCTASNQATHTTPSWPQHNVQIYAGELCPWFTLPSGTVCDTLENLRCSPLLCRMMMAVPLGPGISLKCCNFAPASRSEVRRRAAFASVPICGSMEHMRPICASSLRVNALSLTIVPTHVKSFVSRRKS